MPIVTARAQARYLRVSQRKMIRLCNVVRGKSVVAAKATLIRSPKKGAKYITKVLNSAVANAKNKNMGEKYLKIDKITADMGPFFMRSMPWSRGTAHPIKRRSVHLTIVLSEDEKAKGKGKTKLHKTPAYLATQSVAGRQTTQTTQTKE